MSKFRLLVSAAPVVAAVAFASPAVAQQGAAPQAAQEESTGDIIVTATRRSEALSDVPLAVSAVTAQSLQNSGASDIRALNQLSPSLLVSSTSSEAGAGGARIRGIGTVGDNPGLESSVATFVDGVYRNRAGVGLTELGAVDRIEVLRGPQGTLFGRNASAGLISVITKKPEFNFGAEAEATYGSYNTIRVGGGITGPLGETVAARLDGIYFKRDGFLTDVVSGRKINGRDRYLLRGQLLFQPNDDFSIRLIGDYSDRKEECCGATYLPAQNLTRAADGTLVSSPNSIAGIERALGGIISDNTFARTTALTPGVGYQGNVRDAGVSAEINWKFGDATLTSITAYRDWKLVRGQDADFNNLDILKRLNNGGATQSFKTFTQELRLQGSAFGDKLDWLVGAYFANEKLNLTDNLTYGADYERYANCLLFASVLPSALAPTPTGNCVNQPVLAATATATGSATLAALNANPLRPGFGSLAAAIGQPAGTLVGVGLNDTYNQTSRNYAFFTHNVIRFTDRLSLTLGARYTNEEKTLDATFRDNNTICAGLRASPLAGLATLPCVIPNVPGGSFSQTGAKKSEDRITGTAVLSFKPVDNLLVYASFSRGYKAGGFNLDRSGLTYGAPNLQQLTFEPELVNSYELGYKWNGNGIDLNIAAFRQDFTGFQLNTFNGVNFIVVNINACKTSLNFADRDADSATGVCTSGLKSGVQSAGLEMEAFLRPARHLGVNLGLTYVNTTYGNDLVGINGTALPAALNNLPGSRLSNSSQIVTTASVSWTPPLGNSGLSGLVYADMRYQSDVNTGSDLDREKQQDGVAIVNARLGIRGSENKWGIEVWAQNVFDTNYQQVSFDAPLQGGGTRATGLPATSTSAGANSVQNGTYVASTQLYGVFLAEPRTYGITARFKF
ncbi:TonB-dependent receptor [Sphingomonas sp. SUN039]|uniref:TonB-dependent receptor n=1 Tax=Sphingomonas sp. SUN039 TaxID=2937787 RepID=UPI00216458D1|nr:TonB-dependent receptor [Sphingomonas sp. SUN039]UVO55128.1 TonB-dependent receptor [Sphingomonas sp. SUN039]